MPVEQSHHPNITFLRSILSTDGNSLTLFLTDKTYYDDPFSVDIWQYVIESQVRIFSSLSYTMNGL